MPYFFESSANLEQLAILVNPQTTEIEARLYLKHTVPDVFFDKLVFLLGAVGFDGIPCIEGNLIKMPTNQAQYLINILHIQNEISLADYNNCTKSIKEENSFKSLNTLRTHFNEALVYQDKPLKHASNVNGSLEMHGFHSQSNKKNRAKLMMVDDTIVNMTVLSKNLLVFAGDRHIYFYNRQTENCNFMLGNFYRDNIKFARLSDNLLMYSKFSILYLYDLTTRSYVDQRSFNRQIMFIEKMSENCFALGLFSCDVIVISIDKNSINVKNNLSRGLIYGGGYLAGVRLDDDHILCGYPDNELRTWNIKTGESKEHRLNAMEHSKLNNDQVQLHAIRTLTQLSATIFVSRSCDDTIRVWDISKMFALVSSFPLAEEIDGYSPKHIIALDEKHILCGFYHYRHPKKDDKSIEKASKLRVYNVETGQCEKQFDGFKHSITSLLPLSSGQLAVAAQAGKGGKVSVHELKTFALTLENEFEPAGFSS